MIFERRLATTLRHRSKRTKMDAKKKQVSQEAQSEDVADLIARDIQAGLFAPGSWLKQIDLERRYCRSRGEVRRALDRLAQRRLVVHSPNRGHYVHEADGERVAQIRDIRLVLELSAADSIVERVSAKDIAVIEALARRFDVLLREGTVLEQYDANIAFHLALLSLNANKELTLLVTELRERVSSAPASQWRTRRRIEQSSHEHFQMVEALRARDRERLKDVIRAHILQTG
jgi:DNA-binding GntR family transcriptional regulator